MSTMDMERSEEVWPPDPAAVELETSSRGSEAEGPRTALIRHATAPYIARIPFPEKDTDLEKVQEAALAYLTLAKERAGLPIPPEWLEALLEGHEDFAWLPVEKSRGDQPQLGSLRVDNLREGKPVNRTLVLLAGELSGGEPLGSEVGVRVVVNAPADGTLEAIRITAASCTLPHHADPPFAWSNLLRGRKLSQLLGRAHIQLVASAAIKPGTLSIRGISVLPPHHGENRILIRARGLSVATRSTPSEPYDIVAKALVEQVEPFIVRLETIDRTLLSACGGAAQPIHDFPTDPASHAGPALWRARRPTRTDTDLANELEPDDVPSTLQVHGRFDVVQTAFVPGDQPGAVKTVSLNPEPGIWSNDFTAVSTFHNLCTLFDRFDLYGISLDCYFRRARLPLTAHYRSGVRPGPGKDGQTVNGRVNPKNWTNSVEFLRAPEVEMPQLEMHLALAELPVRARQKWDHTASSHAIPLGFATDPRWIWHESAHVLLMAAFGELEFRFAHSMGDALAAIIEDPSSKLATSPLWRGATFPWVFAPRRHDRCVCDGWGWAGRIGRPLRLAPTYHLKAYLTEQILSTSLFRMYRCLGGDTVVADSGTPDNDVRQNASDYSVYLIMEAVRLLGDPCIVSACYACQFAAALMDADGKTSTCPTSVGNDRVGGTAHKAIRWAFEAQGMYAAPGNETAPGQPPPVDVYIADRRKLAEQFPFTEVTYDPGSYAPVSLDWAGLAAAPAGNPVPDWFADPAAMLPNDGNLTVVVGNRGHTDAQGVRVRFWSHDWPNGTQAPPWDKTWTLVDETTPQDIPTGESRAFETSKLPNGPGRQLTLAEAFCAADRANIDPLSGLAPSSHPVPLEQLVPLDNNLGLIVIPTPD